MIPRLGDGNQFTYSEYIISTIDMCLENDSPSRGRKQSPFSLNSSGNCSSLENDSPSRGRKQAMVEFVTRSTRLCLENDSPSRGRKPTARPMP